MNIDTSGKETEPAIAAQAIQFPIRIVKAQKNPTTILNEFCQSAKLTLQHTYKAAGHLGARIYKCEIKLADLPTERPLFAQGCGGSKALAKTQASEAMLKWLSGLKFIHFT